MIESMKKKYYNFQEKQRVKFLAMLYIYSLNKSQKLDRIRIKIFNSKFYRCENLSSLANKLAINNFSQEI